LPDFDTTLGTLEGIDITLTLTSNSKIKVFNSSHHSVDFTNASLTFLSSVSGPGAKLSTSFVASLASGTAHPGMNDLKTDKTTNSTSEQLDPSVFNLWEDQTKNVVDLTYSNGNPTYQGTDLGHNLLFGGKVKGSGEVTVQYTYLADPGASSPPLAVPEPLGKYLSAIVAAAMTLMLFGRKKLLSA
jgi:hypothetical protein